ncbi:hypothetical protein MKW94_026880 [Papaver nudicaule]|uniref:Leucine-rich repeat-containing N-terminal plant-type domain-containing protein n=1 Tax=Papaver nudicaule TaxID=74823 RepID=A0AA41VHM8_PAPNU|nr:hypothetical protein [Papaver nudicaule]
MRSSQGSRLFLVFFILSFSESWCVQGKCLHDQRGLLLQLNSSLIYASSRVLHDNYFDDITVSSKRSSWSLNTDCCSWDGITCDGAGRVISLDLSSEFISGGINSSSSLFNLHYLERLNLADNLLSSPIPNGFDQLFNLKYLNLSQSGFLGQVPVGILRMPRLVTLDLSYDYPWLAAFESANSLRLDNPDFEMLTHNLTGLRELWLDGINITDHGNKWCRILSTSLPKLQALSLSYCSLSGPLDSSLLKLQSLKILRLNGNNFSSVIPGFFGEFRNLVSLDLSACELYGTFPERIFNLKTLRYLDLSFNKRLQGSLPEFPIGGLLEELLLKRTSFAGELPNSIGNLKHLSRLELDLCGFNGSIPSSISNLNQLRRLSLSSNNFTGLISSISWPETLTMIDLSDNRLVGPISSEWVGLQKLQFLFLQNNSLSGIIPPILFTLPSLRSLWLSTNEFTGHLGEFGSYSSPMSMLLLGGNKLEGCVPLSIFELSKMEDLDLSSNNFSCTLSLEMFLHKFKNLNTLDLSYNSLSITTTTSDNSTLFPQVQSLSLGYCNLTKFPMFLKNQSKMDTLDLPSNNIHGKIPNWIWKIGNGSLYQLNISHNFLEDPYRPFPVNSFTSIAVVDVHSNKLQGKNPILPPAAEILDYSLNNFTSMIPDISSYLSYATFITFSGNQINGNIPASICKATHLNFLDLSHNNLSGPIPQCLGSMVNLIVLNLRGNNLQGFIPETFLQSCSMKTLNLNQNRFEGQVAKSLANCTMLEVLDVGNNRLTGVFPSWLESMQQLHVLVLRSNQFYGPWGNQGECKFPKLQIFDISYNNFSGILSNECFLSWKAMMINEEEAEWNRKDQVLKFNVSQSDLYYQQTVTVRMKGMDVELVKIQTIFTSIDLSNNDFEGEIPGSIGNLTSLYVLNFSNNAFTGPIPSTFGNLTHLESLDLSRNKLTGEIPFQLAALSFLSTLKLSFNKLVGRIPSGNQMQTFPSSYFEGNEGLCGYPLKECSSVSAKSPQNGLASDDREEFDWILLLVTFFGFVMGASVVIGPQYFWKKGREWANERINRILNTT